jgi:hypothetical protein
MTQSADTTSPESSPESNSRSALIATRLRQTARSVSPPVEARLPSFALEHAVAGDAGHLHRAHDLRDLSIESNRRVTGILTVGVRRTLQRLLHPLPEVQTSVNAANARVTTFLLRQLAAQARSIESLERQVEEIQKELHP